MSDDTRRSAAPDPSEPASDPNDPPTRGSAPDAPAAERMVRVGGRTVRVLVGGTSDDPPRSGARLPQVVLVHGLGLGADVWTEHLDRLGRAGYHVLAPDMPGFGESPGPFVGMSVERAADWLASFADRMDVRDAVWVGHSVSTQFVLRLAVRRPDLVRGLVLAAPTGEPGRFRWLAQLVGLARTAPRESLDLVVDVLRHYATTPPWRTVSTWLGARRHDALRDAARCACAVRVVVGAGDPVVPMWFAERLADRAARGDVVRIMGAAHGVALDPAKPFCDVLLAFLDEQSRP